MRPLLPLTSPAPMSAVTAVFAYSATAVKSGYFEREIPPPSSTVPLPLGKGGSLPRLCSARYTITIIFWRVMVLRGASGTEPAFHYQLIIAYEVSPFLCRLCLPLLRYDDWSPQDAPHTRRASCIPVSECSLYNRLQMPKPLKSLSSS